jgi:hypothetical protein
MTAAPAALANTYISAWLGKDFGTLRGLLADDVTFSGPLATLDTLRPGGTPACQSWLARSWPIMLAIASSVTSWLDAQPSRESP